MGFYFYLLLFDLFLRDVISSFDDSFLVFRYNQAKIDFQEEDEDESIMKKVRMGLGLSFINQNYQPIEFNGWNDVIPGEEFSYILDFDKVQFVHPVGLMTVVVNYG